jgi:hypothetical protein
MLGETDPTVLNFVLLGSGFHHLQKKQNLLTELAASIQTGPNQFLHVIDGIGGIADGQAEEGEQHPMMGAYDLTAEVDPQTGELKTEKKSRFFFASAKRPIALITGKGFKDAMNEATTVVQALVEAGRKPLIINFYGFSRGADTALRICNILYAQYENDQVQANVFAIDPVPGLGRKTSKKSRVIPENVANYHAILMANENTPGFEPQDKSRLNLQNSAKTKVTYQFLGGKHNSATYFTDNPLVNPDEDNPIKKITDTPRLAWEAIQRFAKKHGTAAKNIPYVQRNNHERSNNDLFVSPRLTDIQILAAYTRMVAYRDEYAKITPFSERLNSRDFLSNKNNYFLHGLEYFQDQEHMALFQHSYPAFFDYFFQQNLDGFKLKTVLTELEEMRCDPLLVKSFQIIGGLNLESLKTENDLGSPQGIHLTLNDFDGELSNLWDRVLSVVNPVLTDQDKSVDYAKAIAVRDKIAEALSWPVDKENKIRLIQLKVQGMIKDADKPDILFYRKLATILPYNSPVKLDYFSRLEEMIKVASRGTFLKSAMTAKNKHIASLTIQILKDFTAIELGNDKETITRVLHVALIKSRSYITAAQSKDVTLDKTLRMCLAETSSYADIPKTPEVQFAVKQRIEKFVRELAIIPGPVAQMEVETRRRSPHS